MRRQSNRPKIEIGEYAARKATDAVVTNPSLIGVNHSKIIAGAVKPVSRASIFRKALGRRTGFGLGSYGATTASAAAVIANCEAI